MLRMPWIVAQTALLCVVLAGCQSRGAPIPEQWARTPNPTHQPRPLPSGSFDGSQDRGGSLLDAYADRTPRKSSENATWVLPNNGKTIIVEALIAAAIDDPVRMRELLSPTASWGMPHRSQLRARPIHSARDPLGVAFLGDLRNSAARFGAKAKFSCIPLQPNWSLLAESGAEPMWCNYAASDGYDLLVFRLMKYRGELKIDYVGLFTERPTAPTHVPNAGYPPPPTPYAKIDPSEMPQQMFGRGAGQSRSRPRPQPQIRPQPQRPAPSKPIIIEGDAKPDRPIIVEPK